MRVGPDRPRIDEEVQTETALGRRCSARARCLLHLQGQPVGYTPVHVIHTSVLRNFWRETQAKWNGVWGDDVDLYDGHTYSGEKPQHIA